MKLLHHPENWQKIDGLKSGESLFYKDEQNARWDMNFDGKNLSFKELPEPLLSLIHDKTLARLLG